MKLQLLNQEQLNGFASAQVRSQILQSWEWGEFQKNPDSSEARQVWRFGVTGKSDQLMAAAQIIEHLLPLKKSYLYCPRGPIINPALSAEEKVSALQLILSKVRDLTIATSQREEVFFRFEPAFNISVFKSSNLKNTKPTQPADTLILDLELSEKQLLSQMHQKTRYNIRLAEKHGVNIKIGENFAQVWPLFEQTAKKDNFNLHPKNYYQKMLETVPMIKLWQAEHKGSVVAAGLVGYFGDTATYLHGASDYQQRSLMAPYLLHWEIIKNARQNNIKYYDFHGIALTEDRRHPWFGLSRFKKGFGGNIINYPGTFDFIYQTGWYQLYQLFRKINRVLR